MKNLPPSSFRQTRSRRWGAQGVLAGGLVALALLAAGCSTRPGIVFPSLANAPRWPAPPDTPRVLYVGQLMTSVDLKPGVSGWEAVDETIFGKREPQAMNTPLAVCTDLGASEAAQRVFVADSNGQAIHVFDLKTRKYSLWKPGSKEPALAGPVGVAWDPAGRLLVSDGPVIVIFDGQGHYRGQLGRGILQRPCGLVVEPATGNILVADAKAHQVFVLDRAGKLLETIGKRGTALGEFNYPTNVTLDRAGRLYVSDSLNFRVQQFDAQHKPLRQIGKKGDLPGYFSQPKGIATDSEGHLYVLDGQFENVQIFDDTGRVLMDFGEEGTGPGQFWLPAGIFIDRQDRIWVADSYNRRIQVFDYRSLRPEVQP